MINVGIAIIQVQSSNDSMDIPISNHTEVPINNFILKSHILYSVL